MGDPVRRNPQPVTERRIRDAQREVLRTGRSTKLFDNGVRGLFLAVLPSGVKSWRLRLLIGGREQVVALGQVDRPAAVARAVELRALAEAGGDIAARAAELRGRAPRTAPTVTGSTFAQLSAEWMRDRGFAPSTRIRNQRIVDYLTDEIGDTPMAALDKQRLREVLKLIEAQRGGETARRARLIASGVAQSAGVDRDYARELDPKNLFADPRERRMPAITTPAAFGPLLRLIDAYEGGHPITRIALQVLPRVFTRPGELRLAKWSEFDFGGAQWIIPAARMKMRREHIVPLSTQVVALLREAQRHRADDDHDYAFPSSRPGRPLSENTLGVALKTLGYGPCAACLANPRSKHDSPCEDCTPHVAHGFRSSASSMLRDPLDFPERVIEKQLAHEKRDQVSGAYDRAEYLERRRAMMQAWADYLDELVSADT